MNSLCDVPSTPPNRLRLRRLLNQTWSILATQCHSSALLSFRGLATVAIFHKLFIVEFCRDHTWCLDNHHDAGKKSFSIVSITPDLSRPNIFLSQRDYRIFFFSGNGGGWMEWYSVEIEDIANDYIVLDGRFVVIIPKDIHWLPQSMRTILPQSISQWFTQRKYWKICLSSFH